jgi:acyl-coenzyme A thioesterase PaaI-like protein
VVKPFTVTVFYVRGASDLVTHASATMVRLGARIANVEAFAWQNDRSSPIASGRLNFLLERPDQ